MTTASWIPSTFHMVWLGPTPLPKMYLAFAMTWRRHHPRWQLVLWQDHDHRYPFVFDELKRTQSLPIANSTLLASSRSHAARSNILRLEIVALHGGIYLDTDFICHRSIEELLQGVDCFVANQDDQFINNAIFGATKGHPELVRAVQQLPAVHASSPHCLEISTGPHLFTELFRGNPAVTVFDTDTFYPMSWSGHYERGDAKAYATHLWAFSWKHEVEQPSTDVLPDPQEP